MSLSKSLTTPLFMCDTEALDLTKAVPSYNRHLTLIVQKQGNQAYNTKHWSSLVLTMWRNNSISESAQIPPTIKASTQ
jgi:hypothetical protein